MSEYLSCKDSGDNRKFQFVGASNSNFSGGWSDKEDLKNNSLAEVLYEKNFRNWKQICRTK